VRGWVVIPCRKAVELFLLERMWARLCSLFVLIEMWRNRCFFLFFFYLPTYQYALQKLYISTKSKLNYNLERMNYL
jgi:hypothetical protein